MEPMRIARLLSIAGVASRRKAEDLIREGLVSVNGKTVTSLGTRVDPDMDDVRFQGRPLAGRRRPRTYVLMNKPRGYVCTRKDEEGRPSVLELLPPKLHHLYPVGRLDLSSEGLLLLTDDGDFCLRMTHPRYGTKKTYRVKVQGTPTPEVLARLTEGVTLEGERLRAREAHLVTRGPSAWIEVVLAEGKKNEIRRLCGAVGYPVSRLERVGIEFLTLEGLALGRYRTLRPAEVARLMRSESGRSKERVALVGL